jgi:uncharacterized FlaG/YvyC family protein
MTQSHASRELKRADQLEQRGVPAQRKREGARSRGTAAESSAPTTTTPQNQSNIRLVFKVDDKTNKVTVLVVDKESQKVIRSIPFDEQAKLKQGELLELLI